MDPSSESRLLSVSERARITSLTRRIVAGLSAFLRSLDRLHELLLENGFLRVSYTTGAQRGAARRVLIASGDEYDRRAIPASFNLRLNSMPEDSIQVDIQHEATRRAGFPCSVKVPIVGKVSTSNPRTLRSRSTAFKTLWSSSRTRIGLRETIILGGPLLLLVIRAQPPRPAARLLLTMRSSYYLLAGPYYCPWGQSSLHARPHGCSLVAWGPRSSLQAERACRGARR